MDYLKTVVLALAAAAPVARADDAKRSFASGPRQVNVVELYSSEGCDSCPPADVWLGALQAAPGLWTEFVPVAFHVDYWDYLGWRDPLASAAYTARQYAYAHAAGTSSVYTPQVLVGGKDWRDWRRSPRPPSGAANVGRLTATWERQSVVVTFEPARTGGAGYRVHVAKLGFGIEHAVGRGENRGKVLAHNFVALQYASAPLVLRSAALQAALAMPGAAVSTATGLAVWVTRGDDPTPIQATGGYLP